MQSVVGPLSLLGGTAAIYTSLLQHPTSTLNPLSFFLMMLLAVQYAVQPRLSRKYIAPQLDPPTVALVEEVVKTGMAAALFFGTTSTTTTSIRKSSVLLQDNDWTLSSSLAVAGVPAMLYALQGVLQYVSYQHLDAVTFNGLTQTKTLSAALCCYLIMGQRQSPLQMVALGILFASALVFQIGGGGGKNKIQQQQQEQQQQPLQTKLPSTSTSTTSTTNNNNNTTTTTVTNDWVWRGILPCLGAAFLSGLAGALSQKGLQSSAAAGGGGNGRDPFLYTIEISFYSAVTLLFNKMVTAARSRRNTSTSTTSNTTTARTTTTTRSSSFSAYWNWKTLIPIVVKASGGVVTALVHKYAGSVSKGFALMFGLVLSNMIQLSISTSSSSSTKQQDTLQPYQVWGTLMIMSSTWLFFTH